MTRASLRLAAGAAALLMMLAACGSDDPDTATGDGGGTTTSTEAGPAESTDAMGDGDHQHDGEIVDVSELDPPPALELDVLVDDVAGFNVRAVASNHALAPEAASTAHVPGQGHMHLYVDGEKVARVYNEWIHVADLEPGDHEFRVELSANNHSALAVDGEVIDQSVTVTQPDRDDHGHSPDSTDISVDDTPSIDLTVVDDPKSGFNLRAVATGFAVTPANVNGDNVDGEGHMHIYVDGDKLTRLYGEWFHIEDVFGSGEHEVRVELSNNDHSAVAVDGAVIEATASFTSTTEVTDDGGEGHTDLGDEGPDETTAPEADHVVEIVFAEGAVVGGPATIETGTGDTVLLIVTSDVEDELHVHGADVFGELVAGEITEVRFTAEIPGQFEIELENRGQLLATLITT